MKAWLARSHTKDPVKVTECAADHGDNSTATQYRDARPSRQPSRCERSGTHPGYETNPALVKIGPPSKRYATKEASSLSAP